MTVTLQFVDKIDANPTVRLDLNNNVWTPQANGTNLGFPELNRALVSTLLQEGGHVPASAYGFRTLTLRLLVTSADPDANSTATQALFRELARPRNILKFAQHTTAPVFFRTFRSVPDSLEPVTIGNKKFVVVPILAEPFALGLKETLADVTVTNNPDAGITNNMSWDVSGVKGDVEAPAILTLPASMSGQSVFAVRRREAGITPHHQQVELMSSGTDTATFVAGASFSGTGNNGQRTTFATTMAMAKRITTTAFGALVSGTEVRGTYRVFARLRKNTAGDSIRCKVTYGPSDTVTDAGTVTLPASTANIVLVDFGLMTAPIGFDPYDDGSGAPLPVDAHSLAFWAERASGSGTLDVDFLLFVPADDRFAIVSWGATAPSANWVFNVDKDAVYGGGSVGEIEPVDSSVSFTSGGPLLTPGETNRIYLIRDVTPGVATVITTTTVVSLSYYPRYLFDRPVAT